MQSYFWSVFTFIWTEYGEIRSISPSEYRKIRTRKNSVIGHFSCSGTYKKMALLHDSANCLSLSYCFVTCLFCIIKYHRLNYLLLSAFNLQNSKFPWLFISALIINSNFVSIIHSGI